MHISDFFPSNYLKAEDLQGQTRQVVIFAIGPEKMADGEVKPVIRFTDIDKGLVTNKTNAMVLASAFGPDMDAWTGKTIELYPDKVNFNGRIVDCIRVRIHVPPTGSKTAQPALERSAPTQAAAVDPGAKVTTQQPNWG